MRHRNHIYVCEEDAPGLPVPDGLSITRYDRLEDIPQSIIEGLVEYRGSHYPDLVRQELEDRAVFWVATLDGRVAASQFTRHGKYFTKWFVPIDDDDIVVFGGSISPALRGRGIIPIMIQDHVKRELVTGARAYADCRVWNKPAIRCIEKAGFRRIATMKPLRRKDALGE